MIPEQVLLAIKLQLPLVLHIRDAEEDGIRVLEAAGLPEDWPVHRHCFTGSSVENLLNYKLNRTKINANLRRLEQCCSLAGSVPWQQAGSHRGCDPQPEDSRPPVGH